MKVRPILLGLLFLAACNKDKFQTKPTIEIKSLSSKVATAPDGTLHIRLKFTDKEGDLGNGQLTYIRIRTNSTPIPNPGIYDKVDTITTPIPQFPLKDQGEMDLLLDYNFMDEDPNRNDSMFFKITCRDLAGHNSDTISSPVVVAKQN